MLKNERNPFLVMIISCWILLMLAFICKLFGAKWFEPSVDNEKFISFCNWLDNHWQIYIVSTIFYIFGTYIPYLIITEQRIGKDLWVCLILLPCSYLKDGNVLLTILGFLLEMIVLAIIPLVKLKGRKRLRIVVVLILILAFEVISNLTKIYTWHLKNTSSLVSILLNIDYYILIMLSYLYSIKRGDKNEMGSTCIQ